MAQQSNSFTVGHALRKLSNIVDALRQIGLVILCVTTLNLVLSVAALFARINENQSKIPTQLSASEGPVAPASSMIGFFSVLVGLAVLFAIINFESSRKQGNALFEEISDELQWLPVKKETESNLPEYRPNIEVRLILRSFVQCVDLPLIPGRFGPILYVIINVILMITAWIPL